MVRIKNWSRFQHFKDRRPPWIKLYRDLLDDVEWFKLRGEAKGLLINLWLIASENNGDVPDIETLSFRLRLPTKEIATQIITLSHWLEQLDIAAISSRYQLDTPEKRREETEREVETEKEREKTTASRARNIGEIAPTDFKPPAVTDKTKNGTHAPIARLVGLHVDFIRKFGESYEAMTGEPFKAGNKAYEIAKQLIDRYGAEAVEKKAKILGRMCADQTAWFTKDGWADFTIEKISVQWNSIIATYKETPEDKKRREDLEALKKVREKNERANEAIRRYGAGTSRR